MRKTLSLFALLLVCGGTSVVSAAPIAIADVKHEGNVDFEKEVLPILRNKCLACHNTTEAESDLVLETPQTILKGGAEGPSVVAGKSAESLLLKLASHASEPIMPPKGNDVGAKALTSEELGLLKLWIDQGAKGEVLGAAAPITWQPLPPGVTPIYAAAVSQTGEFAAVGRANQVFLYHLPSKRELGRLTDPKLLESGLYKNPGVADLDLIQAVAFSPAGDLLATGGYRTLKLWRRPRHVRAYDVAPLAAAPRSSAASADGKWLAIGDEAGSIQLLDAATGKLAKELKGHAGAVSSLEFTADSAQLVSASLDKSVRLWDVASGQQVARIDTPAEAHAVRLVAKGMQIAVGGNDNLVRLYSVPFAAAEPLSKLAIKSPVTTVTSDRKYVATATGEGQIVLFDLTTGAQAMQLAGHPGGVTYLQFNAANNRLVSIGADKKVAVWDFGSSKQLTSVTPETGAAVVASINAAGNQLAVGGDDGVLRTWKLEGETATVEHAKIGDHGKKITALVFVNDGSAFLTASEDGTVRRFASNGQQQFSANHGAAVRAIALAADQQTLASGGDDKQLKLWNAGNGSPGPKPQLAGFAGAPQAIAFSPDNTKVIAADGSANQVLVFDIAQGVLDQGFADLAKPATSLAVLPQGDKQLFVLAASGEQSTLIPMLAGRKLAGHNTPIVGIATLGEAQMATLSADGAGKVWDLNSGNPTRDFNHGGPATGVVVRADGKRLITAGANNIAKLLNLENNQTVELRGDLDAKYKVEQLQRSLALAKRHIELAKKDYEEATKRKTAEEENAKKAAELVKTTDTEAKAKTEAAKQPIADKEAADKALAEATAAKTAAEEAKKKADEAQAAASEALKVATQARDAASADDKAAKEKVVAEADAAKKAADAAKQKADQDLNAASNAMNQAMQKVQQLTQPYQKAVDERNAATRNYEAAMRSVERSAISVKQATEAIPMYEAAVKTAEATAQTAEQTANAAAMAAQQAEKPYKALALSGDGLTVAIAGDGANVYTFDTEAGAAIDSFAGHAAAVSSLAFGADGKLLSTAADKSIMVWNTTAEWKLERVIGSADPTSPIVDRVTAIDFSPDGSLVASGSGEPSRSGELKVWKVADGSLAMEIKEPHSDTIYDVEFSPSGQHLASCGADRFMKVFDLSTGKLHRSYEGHTHHVLGVTWRADGRVLCSAGADNVVKVWNFLTGDQLRTIQGFGKEVTSITFAGDGDGVVASSGDKSVRLKNADNGGDVRNYGGASDYLYAVASSGDGKTIVAGGADGVLFVWNEQGQEVARFAPPAPASASTMK